MAWVRTASLMLVFLVLGALGFAQTGPALSSDQIMDRVAPSLVLVLAGDETGKTVTVASGVIVRTDGLLLAPGDALRDAKRVQVRLKSGDVYDQVQLIGFDDRRHVAALRIIASELPAVTVAGSAQVKPGTAIYAVTNGAALRWNASAGLLSSTRLAEDVAGAGSGYRLLQFTTPIMQGSSGGVLVDAQARAVGIVIPGLLEGRNAQFAVPLDAVMGLASMPGGSMYASGADLPLPKVEPLPDQTATQTGVTDKPNSPSGESREPQAILREFRYIYIDARSSWLKATVMKTALLKRPELREWGIAVVEEPTVADVVLRVNLVKGTVDYTYEVLHQNTSIVLISGKVMGLHLVPWMSGNAAAPKIADGIVKNIRAAGRALPSEESKKQDKAGKKS